MATSFLARQAGAAAVAGAALVSILLQADSRSAKVRNRVACELVAAVLYLCMLHAFLGSAVFPECAGGGVVSAGRLQSPFLSSAVAWTLPSDLKCPSDKQLLGVQQRRAIVPDATSTLRKHGSLQQDADSGNHGATTWSDAGQNVALLLLFAFQHSVMARKRVQRAIQSLAAVPHAWARPIERFVFVGLSSGILRLTYHMWRPLPTVVWWIDPDSVLGIVIRTIHKLAIAGTMLCIVQAWYYDQFDIRGPLTGVKYPVYPRDHLPFLHRFARQPLFGSQILAHWTLTKMTAGSLLFAMFFWAYTRLGVYFQERDNERDFGEAWRLYRQTTSHFLPYWNLVKAKWSGEEQAQAWRAARCKLFQLHSQRSTS